MKPYVYLAKPVPEEVENYIAEHCSYDKWEGSEPIPRSELLQKLGQAEGLLITGEKIDDELLDHAPNLKVVSNISVGYNNFDTDAMKRRNIIGTNTPDVLNETVADLALALMLSAARRVPELDKLVKDGKWEKKSDEPLFGVDVHGKTLGIIGMGRIGEAIGRRAKFGFNMDILYHNRHRKMETEKELDASYVSQEELLQKSDFVLLMVPFTEETKHLMGREQFAQMKKSAIFINTSRGQTVDEGALTEALQNGKILAAGLDVFDQEPVSPDNPLLELPNVVTLPHIGSATYQTRFDMAMLAVENLVAAVTGKEPASVVGELKGVLK
ncbi:gluconate 2-dehydrogenase [Fictibacillus enclensis]|uniref:D-glycerate dehydrogenase n=1 Tax=Fictibacillus enclensis TaxID=1017270 RepID=A0A0V8J4Y2_9BACL|nr:D-glycerate dehydrogenase [Fictibacillus enclensis]KSU82013.1 D-glycerate dehydrogenase [Fictibacillus enclensis]SCC29009.1 gluconate 2-dehydrogenase [Fictibacillus enclensis]